ncbi:helix-turn-helix transcriptional regulator, partial [Streptomyces sp. NPDC049949]|uniref:helix-turn-helix domain-containing protein n=1 Tax=Streptomyces sp. NPDC049949 TaxID=3154627 RepID=UPI003431378D
MTESVGEPRLPSPKERRRLREAAGLTYEAIATAVGVRANTVRSWESGRTHPRGRKLDAYAALLGSMAPTPADADAAPDVSGAPDAAAAPAGAAPPDALPDAPPDAAPPGRAPGAVQAPGAMSRAGTQDPAGAAPGGTPAGPGHEAGRSAGGEARGGAVVRLPGGLRPFGMSGPGQRTRPPVAAKRAARPPTAVPRHEARYTVKATARAIGRHRLRPPGARPWHHHLRRSRQLYVGRPPRQP